MKYLLDTNICIYIINRKPDSVIRKLTSHSTLDIGISPVTVSELEYGVEKSSRTRENREALKDFLSPFVIPAYDQLVAHHYGILRARLEKQGRTLGALDMMIAAHAVSLGATLVTNDTKDFAQIHGLKTANWV